MTANEFLSGEEDTVFDALPIFPVLGEEARIDGRLFYKSAIRDARDVQTSFNYHRTAGVEVVGMQPKAPFILTSEQIEGFKDYWDDANRTTRPYLLYRHVPDQPKPNREPVPQPAQAELMQARQDAADIQTIVGLHEASLGAESNERTGRAVLARQAQGATATFHFPENQRMAIEAMGRVLARAIPKVYDTERVSRLRLPDGGEDSVVINESVLDAETGVRHIRHDLGAVKYDCVIDTGAMHSTSREEGVNAMLELVRVMPPAVLVPFAHLLVKNMGFPGSSEIAGVLRKMVPDNLKTPEELASDLPPGVVMGPDGIPIDEETQQPWQKPPTPEERVAQMENQTEQAKSQAAQAKAQADMAHGASQASRGAGQDRRGAAARRRRPRALRSYATGRPDAGTRRRSPAPRCRNTPATPTAHAEAIKQAVGSAFADLMPGIRQLAQNLTANEAKRVQAEISARLQPAAPPAATPKPTPRERAQIARIDFKTDDKGNMTGDPAVQEGREGRKGALDGNQDRRQRRPGVGGSEGFRWLTHFTTPTSSSFWGAGLDLTTLNVRFALVDLADYTFSSAHDFMNDVDVSSAVVAETGNLASKTTTDGTFDAADPTFSSVTGDQCEGAGPL